MIGQFSRVPRRRPIDLGIRRRPIDLGIRSRYAPIDRGFIFRGGRPTGAGIRGGDDLQAANRLRQAMATAARTRNVSGRRTIKGIRGFGQEEGANGGFQLDTKSLLIGAVAGTLVGAILIKAME